jgi:hypothetical protein
MGKSTIARTVAADFDGRKQLGASFFFSESLAGRRVASAVIPTIAFQLAKFSPELRQRISLALEEDPGLGMKVFQDQLNILLADSPSGLPHSRPTLVVIDALDECEEDGAFRLLSALVREVGKLTPFKFLVTSRPEPHIQRVLDHALTPGSTVRPAVLHDMAQSVVKSDIKRYLAHHLEGIGSQRGISAGPWPKEGDVDSLAEKAAGLFVFAATAVRFIGSKFALDPQERIDVLLRLRPATGEKPFEALDAIYLRVLKSSVPEEQIADETSHLRSLLGTVSLLQDPLPTKYLERLLNLHSGNIISSLRLFHSLLVVPSDTAQTIHIIHPSFSDFLTSHCNDPRFKVNPSSHHEKLALSCFRVMRQLRRDICGIEPLGKLNSEVKDKLPPLIDSHVPQELRYACKYWASHVSKMSSKSKVVEEALRLFLSTHLLHWLEVLSLLGRSNDAALCLLLVKRWSWVS